MIFPRQRKTKYHERTYTYEVLSVLVYVLVFSIGVGIGWALGA